LKQPYFTTQGRAKVLEEDSETGVDKIPFVGNVEIDLQDLVVGERKKDGHSFLRRRNPATGPGDTCGST
jgi:hypothetical protein